MLEYARINPFRVPDWRWFRAQGIRSETQPPATQRRDEALGYKWIRAAIRFQEALTNAGEDKLRHLQLAEDRPAIFWAHQLYTREQTMRDAVEAYILSRQSDYEIGYRCGLPAEVIAAYEGIFFNVREKLDHGEYVLHCVIGPALQGSLSDRSNCLLWKLYGYFCGPHFLSGLISKFPSPVWCQTPDAMSAAIQDDAISTLKLKAAIAAKTVPVTQSTQLALMEQFTKFVEVERTTESQGRAQDQILGHIQALFAALPFEVGGPGRNGMDNDPMCSYDQGSIELTFQETMRVSARQPLPNADLLQRLSFPTTNMTQRDLEAEKLAERAS